MIRRGIGGGVRPTQLVLSMHSVTRKQSELRNRFRHAEVVGMIAGVLALWLSRTLIGA